MNPRIGCDDETDPAGVRRQQCGGDARVEPLLRRDPRIEHVASQDGEVDRRRVEKCPRLEG
ncbi:hypothetical protein [Rhodococcus sp. CX]|uniref:hypothetical protein n=1 Tax=Rhodococcus sp. CX TaxID=2789880 RepID=UPI001E65AA65|nr:hypothetical protein [Rhodococcus sp. CX]